MFNVSPIVRLAVGLILLTVSLLLVGDLLGLMPNETRAEQKARKVIAESLAVQVSANISSGRMDSVIDTLRAMHERNPDVQSIGLRRADGRLIATAGDHVALWATDSDERSTETNILVPIYSDDGAWGRVEVSFGQPESLLGGLLGGGSVATVVLFIAFAGFATYWLFLKRALNELDPSAVVPDRVRTALDTLAEGLVILDGRGRIVLANTSFSTTLGENNEELVGTALSALRWEDDHQATIDDEDLPWHTLLDSGNVPEASQIGLVTRTKQRLLFAVNCSPVRAPDGRMRGVIVTLDDLTELEKKNTDLERALERLEHSQREITRQNQELHVLATRDPLTGVLNRRSLFEGMTTLLRESADTGQPLSVIMVDIDHFKSINDRFGHATGDKVIKLLADILTQNVRVYDIVGRYGGEEFCVALPGMNEEQAAEVAERMRVVVHDGKSAKFTSAIRISASFGVSSTTDANIEPSALVDLADKALYEAKESGRNRVKRWSLVADGQPAAPAAPEPPAAQPPASEHEPGEAEATTTMHTADDSLTRENAKLRDRVGELEKLLGGQIGKTWRGVDETTGLPSRVVLIDRINQAIQRCQRSRTRMAVLSLDIDAVDLVRTSQGQSAADKLLKVVSARLHKSVRAIDTVAVPMMDDVAISVSALGNGEFIVLLTDMAQAESTTWVVERMFGILRGTVEIDGQDVLLDANVGIAVYPADGDSAERLMANSATAMREAASTPDSQVALYFNKTMNERSRHQIEIRSQLAHAIERDEFYLEYQPSIGLTDGAVVGFEALIRWRHPERGLVRPDVFIPVAEHAGLIDQIGEWVLGSAAAQVRRWHDMGLGDISVSVNFSALQFRRADLVERVIRQVEQAGIAPSSIVVEITESALIRNLDTAVEAVGGLSEAGFRIALDDFGTGYSSLSYLRRFPIDIVKIDRSFLQDFPSQAQDTEIVSAIIAIAHNLGLVVVAEGVENESQLAALQKLHCDEIQGYLFSKPVSHTSAEALLQDASGIRRILRGIGGPPTVTQLTPVPLDIISGASPRDSAATR